MGIQTDYTPDFTSSDFRSFLVNPNLTNYEEKGDVDSWKNRNYSEYGPSKLIESLATGKVSDQFTCIIREYDIFKADAIVGNISILFPVRHKLEIEVYCVLLLPKPSNNRQINNQKIIKDEWDKFVINSEDPFDFAEEQQRKHGIHRDEYEIRVYCIFQKLNAPGEEVTTSYDAVVAMYTRHETGHRLILVSSRTEENVPNSPPDDPLRSVDDPSDIEDKIEENKERHREATGCELGHNTPKKKIGKLAEYEYPELKIVWENEHFSVGCLKFTWTVPRLMTRTTTESAYFYALHDDFPDYVMTVLIDCLVKGAFNLEVWALLIADQFTLALDKYRVIVVQCIVERFNKEKDCFIPELITVRKKTPWTYV